MKIYLTNQSANFKKHLDLLKTKPVMTYDKTRLVKKVATINLSTTRTINELDLH